MVSVISCWGCRITVGQQKAAAGNGAGQGFLLLTPTLSAAVLVTVPRFGGWFCLDVLAKSSRLFVGKREDGERKAG